MIIVWEGNICNEVILYNLLYWNGYCLGEYLCYFDLYVYIILYVYNKDW